MPEIAEINDEGSDATLSTTTTETPTPTTTTNNDARAKAQARRKRILEASQRRVLAVNGIVEESEKENISIKDKTEKKSDFETMENKNEIADSNDSGTATMETSDTGGKDNGSSSNKKVLSGSARLKQMRRQRYKKSANKSVASDSSNVSTTTSSNSDGNILGEETKVLKEKENELEGTVNKSTDELKTSISIDTKTVVDTGLNKEKKKYMGVAKMRRKMLNEKKQKEQEFQQTSSNTSDVKALSKEEANEISIGPDLSITFTNKQIKFSLMLQLITALLLFSSGFWVGYQNPVSKHATNIHKDLALVHESRIVSILLHSNESISSHPKKVRKNIHDIVEIKSQEEQQEDDEFTPDNLSEDDENIDPLLRVNLDLYTSGPGFVQMMARQAVKFHRFFIITIPRSIFSYLYCPPLLFFLGIALRRGIKFTGNLVGILPMSVLLEDEKNNRVLNQDENQKDLVVMATSTIKKMVSGFIPEFFWTFWECWWDLRKDMYIILCGMLMGMTMPLYFMNSDDNAIGTGNVIGQELNEL